MNTSDHFYEDDLSYIHDVGFGAFVNDAGPGLLKILYRYEITGGLVVDLGCGSGIWARTLADAGFEVTGIDISPTMVEMARRRVPEGVFRVGSFREASFPTCDVITAIGEVLNYVSDKTNPVRLDEIFSRVYQGLREGGLFVFDLLGPEVTSDARNSHRSGEDWAVLVDIEEDPQPLILRRKITTFRRYGDGYRRSEEVHRQQLVPKPTVMKWLTEAGFKVEVISGYGQFPFRRGLTGFVACK